MTNIEKIIQIAKDEIGYLEKVSNAYLYDKTLNAGSGNFTKYWLEISPNMNGQAWCQCFVDWCVYKALGKQGALNALYMPNWTYYTPTAADYFKKNNAWSNIPAVGSIIYFKNDTRICHTGIVYKFDNIYVYTIEGNTSSSTGVVANGGGVFEKKYALNNSRIAGYGYPTYISASKESFSSVGVDLSKYNTVSNYKSIYEAGVKFAILKVIEKSRNIEPAFEKHYKGCTEAGINVIGCYNYSYATDTDMAKKDANAIIKILNNRKMTIWLDVEDKCQVGLDSKLIDIIDTFKNTVESQGYTFGLYCSKSWYKDYIKPHLNGRVYKVWIAAYGKNSGAYDESYKPDVPNMTIWQYTSKGIISGIEGFVDMDVYFGDIESKPVINVTPQKPITEEPVLILSRITASSLNIRTKPGTDGAIIGHFKKGDKVTLVSKTSNNWYKTSIGGYISGDYVEYVKAKVVNCNKLNVRSTPTSQIETNKIKVVPVNTMGIVMAHLNGWYQIIFSDGVIGWCSEKYIMEL